MVYRFKNVKYKYFIILITSIIKYNKFFICSLSFIPSFTLFISKYILSFKNSLDGHIFLFYSKHSSFPSTHKYFVSHFDFLLHSLLFPIKKKKKSSPFLEQVKSFSQWFGINAIFHKNAIENRVLTDLAARRCSNEEFLFRYRFHEPLAKKWFGYGITRCNSRCESTIPASRRR